MSKAIETLGHMDPHTNPATVSLKTERVKYWLEKGAQASNTVHNLLVTQGVIAGEKLRVVTGKKAETKPVAEPVA